MLDTPAGAMVEHTAFQHGLLVLSTHPNPDGYAGDQTLMAPAFIATDAELGEMVERFAATVGEVERAVKRELSAAIPPARRPPRATASGSGRESI